MFFFLLWNIRAPPQIFNDLDVQDDKLMLDLAVFLNRLVSHCGLVFGAWG